MFFTCIPSSLSVVRLSLLTNFSESDFGAKTLEALFTFTGTSWEGRIALKIVDLKKHS